MPVQPLVTLLFFAHMAAFAPPSVQYHGIPASKCDS